MILGRLKGIALVCAPVKRPYRVVVAKPGLDGHDRGAKTITRALRDHGFEVIYTGSAPDARADRRDGAAGRRRRRRACRCSSGAHLTLFPRVMEELRARGLDDVLVFGGGVIPEADVASAQGAQGVAEIFRPGRRR